ncbi:Crp/Fnr family transcriptional regulator [Caulobacter sp. KR2-114]|uniref:Crp/Fnr family transcriptional regulator n=1 Tax=Caulobacter sp. KR2-114 TaxID=3400912 RepID=UPI003BFED0E1
MSQAPAPSELSGATAALARSPVFGVLGETALARLAAAGTITDLPVGAMLAQKGDAGDCAWLILRGEIEVRALSAGGRQTRLAVLSAGDVAGEMSAIDGGERSADMAATRHTRLLRLSRAALLDALADNPQAAVALVVLLSTRIRALDDEMEARQVLDLGGRLARALMQQATPEGLVSVTQGALAHLIGASREKVNRKLGDWVRDGIVRVEPGGVRIASAPRLEALAAQAWSR